MSRLADERGMTLAEVLVAMVISLAGFGLVLGSVEMFVRDAGTIQRQNEAQDTARTTMDRLAVGLRNAITGGTSSSSAAVERAVAADLIYQQVDPLPAPASDNKRKAMRVRYCLNADNPADEILYVQTQRWTTATPPGVPAGTTCPAAGWDEGRIVARNLTNQIGGQSRPVFTYAPAGWSQLGDISAIETHLVVDVSPGRRPGERSLTSGTALRNANRPPIAEFTVKQIGGHVLANASTSYDQDGDALAYTWSVDDTIFAGQTSAELDYTGSPAGSTIVITLSVGDGAATTSVSRSVVVQ
ncbi:MAG: hypothetical protein M3P50_04760 [Actinomycetota bacterium]|nr:hypothetical protein [Actinomycetota bacterium]